MKAINWFKNFFSKADKDTYKTVDLSESFRKLHRRPSPNDPQESRYNTNKTDVIYVKESSSYNTNKTDQIYPKRSE